MGGFPFDLSLHQGEKDTLKEKQLRQYVLPSSTRGFGQVGTMSLRLNEWLGFSGSPVR